MHRFRRALVGHVSQPTTGCWCEGDFATVIECHRELYGLHVIRHYERNLRPLAIPTVDAERYIRIYAVRGTKGTLRSAGSLVLQSLGRFCTRSITRLIFLPLARAAAARRRS